MQSRITLTNIRKTKYWAGVKVVVDGASPTSPPMAAALAHYEQQKDGILHKINALYFNTENFTKRNISLLQKISECFYTSTLCEDSMYKCNSDVTQCFHTSQGFAKL